MPASTPTKSTSDESLPAQPIAVFISDLHLTEEMPATTQAFLCFLTQIASQAQQLYLLGDIFEYWAGDDDLASPFLQQITGALRHLSDQGVILYWMAGNRDFLVSNAFATCTGATLLADPYQFEFASTHFTLTHGDQLCTDDHAYQQFRAQVRQPEWQSNFLARPLAERKAIIAGMRQQSQLHQEAQLKQSAMIMDVNASAVSDLFSQSQSDILIHGHTHRPGVHQQGKQRRYVLSDWDLDNEATRGDWLALQGDGSLQRHSYSELNLPD